MSRNQHEEYRKYLGEFAVGELDSASRAEVGDHVESCPICQDWLAGYHLIELALAERARADTGEHPTSEEIVRFALVPPSAVGVGLGPVARHVRDCRPCSVEVDLCRGAVLGGQTRGGGWSRLTRARARQPLPELGAKALRVRPEGRRRKRVLRVATAVAAVLGVAMAALFWIRLHSIPHSVVLEDKTFTGHRTIEATESIVLSRSRVELDATITLRAARVALGDGFSLDKGARLTIDAPASARKR